MNDREPTLFRRLMIALDACADLPLDLERAGDLAARLQSELVGIFFEDPDLLRSAALPFVRQIELTTGTGQALETGPLREELRGRAARARRLLEETATRRQVRWSFRIVVGEPDEEVGLASQEADLLVVSSQRFQEQTTHFGFLPRTVRRCTRCSILVLRPESAAPRSILAVADEAGDPRRVVHHAGRLARALEVDLRVLVTGLDADRLDAFRDQVEEWVAQEGVSANTGLLEAEDLAALSQKARAAEAGLLVLDAESAFAVPRLLDRVACPVLLVR